jgi:hypothetical protein
MFEYLYATVIYSMQSKKDIQSLSRLRLDLQRLLKELGRSVKVVFGRKPLVKGNVYELSRKCGKPSCACTRGELHRSMVLSWSQRGKTRLLSIPPERLAELRAKTEEYLRVRKARADVTVLYKQILTVIDRMEKLRLEEP